ncbi:MAG: HD domain-containing protein [Nitrospiraceae bacterium]
MHIKRQGKPKLARGLTSGPPLPHREAPLLLSKALAGALLRLYDVPDPRKPGRLIRGYDRPHALRTARMCAAVAEDLGHPPARVRQYQIACLLHDLGRAGLDRNRFGAIWSWARHRCIPTRPREWRAVHPATAYGRETEAFLARYAGDLERDGIPMDRWSRAQVEMRLGYARRLARRLREVKPELARLGVRWVPWMARVMLYYYYPEKLHDAQPWVRQLAEVLVACEQFEAYSNRRRGQDYYTRSKETLAEAFAYLNKLQMEGILSGAVIESLRSLAAEGMFDRILSEARGRAISVRERNQLKRLAKGGT